MYVTEFSRKLYLAIYDCSKFQMAEFPLKKVFLQSTHENGLREVIGSLLQHSECFQRSVPWLSIMHE